MTTRAWVLAVGLSVLSGSARADDWPGFRGADGFGISTETDVPTSWGPDENILWKVSLPEPGSSSPIVSRGRVFLTCATDSGRERHLFCFDRNSGKQLWVRTVRCQSVDGTHKSNPYGSSTPVTDGQLVVVWHGSAGLFCYDFEGRQLWVADKSLGEFRHVYGYGTSPIIHDSKVVLNFGPGDRTFMTALDLQSGQVLWKADEPGGHSTRQPRITGSFSTPVIAKVQGQDQIVCSMPKRVVAYEPDSGRILWTIDMLPHSETDLVYTSPLLSGGIGFVVGGYRGPAMAFRLGGSGDMTKSNFIWGLEKGQPERIGSGVIIDGYIYMANAGPGTAQCIELETGRQRWQARLGSGIHWGSIVAAGGKLFVTNQNGMTQVFSPNPEKFELLASNDLGEPSNSTPAISDGRIYLRTFEHLYAIGR